MDEIPEEILKALKDYLHIVTDDDDVNLKAMTDAAYTTLKAWCGSFDLENLIGRQLVFDYVRFMRSGASEFFYERFRPQIHSFAFGLMEVPDEEPEQV